MNHSLDIVLIFTYGFALASLFSYITQRLNLSPILGYLFAGYVIGPYSPGFVADSAIAEQLAEIGVVLMMFGVGLHFKLDDLYNVKNIAIPGATGQTLVATITTAILVSLAGWPLIYGIILGLAIGVASTVVLVKMLVNKHLLNTPEGHVAIGWLIVEDIFTVIILILLPTLTAFSQDGSFSVFGLTLALLIALCKFIVLVLFMFTWGHKVVNMLLTNVARLRSQEMFLLAVFALIFLIATGSTFIFGTSIALGAFIAGMVIGKTHVRHQAAAQAFPLKDIFTIVFFISVGMIFNPVALFNNYPLYLGLLTIILIIKPLSAYLITIFLGYSTRVAITVALSLAQIGEFSFILAEEALRLDLLTDDGYDLLVGCAFVSISLNPILFNWLDRLVPKLSKLPWPLAHNRPFVMPKSHPTKNVPRAIVVGYNAIGKAITSILHKSGYEPLIIEQNIDLVTKDSEQMDIIFGDAAEVNILKEASIESVRYLMITINNTEKSLEIIHSARQINPNIRIITLVGTISEVHHMNELRVNSVCNEKEALKAYISLVTHILTPPLKSNDEG